MLRSFSRCLRGGMQIKIAITRPLPGKAITLDIDTLDTIGDVRMKIQESEGIPWRQLRLMYEGFHLKDDRRSIVLWHVSSVIDSTVAWVLLACPPTFPPSYSLALLTI